MRITTTGPRSPQQIREGGIAPRRASINSHTRSRTLLHTSAIPAMPWWSISFSDRHIVGTDPTCPNSRC